jgi:hypothetical protein
MRWNRRARSRPQPSEGSRLICLSGLFRFGPQGSTEHARMCNRLASYRGGQVVTVYGQLYRAAAGRPVLRRVHM